MTVLDVRTRAWADHPGGDFAFEQAATAGGTVAAVVSGPAHPGEVYTLAGTAWTRRTNTNPWLDSVPLTHQAVHRFTASDGVAIEGVLLYPADFREGTRYPLVIVAHGGPEAHYTNQWVTTYNEWGQMLSRGGYFVWYPDYRSSTGRGVAFAKADHGDPMGREFQDHLDAIDDFVARGWVDRARVGIGGGSYGGYTAAWAATRHTEHFAAAVSSVPITWVPGLVYTSDIPWEFYYVHYEEQWPHQAWDFMAERSPLTYAPQTRTPLLILGGTWSSYRRDYQEWFVRRCFDALNGVVSDTVQEAHQVNETSAHRNVGLVVETRPDHVDRAELTWLRSLGVTKIQMGAQSLDDRILALNQRGHTVSDTRQAVSR